MNAKELKVDAETKIKTIVKDFVSQTGLELSYIKIEKEKTTGFVGKSEDTKVSIILE